jgi:hypothetical protein|nr:MAG TPA: hypothetical protein [Caudoviricetes sp.]
MVQSTIDKVDDTTILRMIRNLADVIDQLGLDPATITTLQTKVDNLVYYVGKDTDLVPNYPF